MPGEDGLTLCRRVRAAATVPIIMLTAMGDDTDRIVGLEMGADDYLVKPFNPRELLARIKAILRRSSLSATNTGQSRLEFEGWVMDLARRELTSPDGRLIDLTGGEFDLLVAFAEHPQRTLSRDQLLDLTRGRSSSPFDRSIDIQVSRLRQKVEVDAKDPKLIKTVPKRWLHLFHAGVGQMTAMFYKWFNSLVARAIAVLVLAVLVLARSEHGALSCRARGPAD